MMSPFEIATKIANTSYDGHLTIFKFTSGWKVMFGTPSDLEEVDRMILLEMHNSKSMEEALLYAIALHHYPGLT